VEKFWPSNETTQELLEQVRAGNSTAVDRLLEKHRDALRRLVDLRLDRRIRQRIDASDIVQDVLLDANRRLRAYAENPSMPFHLWLRQMARDRVIDAHRRHRGSSKRSVDREQSANVPLGVDGSTMELAAQLSDQELTPAAAAVMHELHLRFQAAIEEMSEDDREIILMRHFEELSNQEVAQALGLSEPAASMRYLRAIRRLRMLLDVSGHGERP
jgi:RNA polymerase sigma-70 factor (ECF subfamily)